MRRLAMVAVSFSCAVFFARYCLTDRQTVLLGGGLAVVFLGMLAISLSRRGRGIARVWQRSLLICAGLTAGLLWTAVYTAIFFQPALRLDGKTVVLEGMVTNWPQETDYGYSVLVQAETDGLAGVQTLLYTDEQGKDLRPGDQIATVAHCTAGDLTFSGEEITYYTAKGIFLRGQAFGTLSVDRPEKAPLRLWSVYLSEHLKRGIDRAFDEETAPFVRALVTGSRDRLTDVFTSSLQRTGLSHVVAVSGMHLAFLTGMIGWLYGRGGRFVAMLVMIWIVLFCGIAGATPSVMRAAVMIALLQVATLFGRERDGVTALSTALMLLLIQNPFSATHLGLQLSFGAVAGIMLVSDRIGRWMMRLFRLNKAYQGAARYLVKPPRFGVRCLSATMGAMVFTVPLVALYFGYISLISPVSNLLTLFPISILFIGGLFAGLLGIACPPAAVILAWPLTWIARYLAWVIDALGRLPLASLPLESLYFRGWIVFVYVLLGLALAVKGRKSLAPPMCAAALTLVASILLTAFSFHGEGITAVVLDVGQGQSVLLSAENYLTLVDCGGERSGQAGDTAADFIQALGRNTLDLLVLSHYHSDHANGIPQLLRRIEVSALAVPDVEQDDPLREEILSLAQEQGVEVWFIQEDTTIYLGEQQVLTIYAPFGQRQQSNELGLTVLASDGAFDFLITGDMDGTTEGRMLDQVALPDIEVLVAGHHGSRHSSIERFLAAVRPELAVISSGKNNSYGHPHPDTLARLEQAGAQIYRTDLMGSVTIKSRVPAA